MLARQEYDLVEQQLTAFSAQIKTGSSIKLHAPPFSKYNQIISAPGSYEASQALGSVMRKAEIQAFTYQSARDPNRGVNVGLFTAKAFSHKKPDIRSFQSWQCLANSHLVEFVRSSTIVSETISFSLDQFKVEKVLPFPAN